MDDAMIENCASRLRKAALACGIPQIVCRFARGVPGGVLAILLWGAAPAQAEIFRVADMVRGVLITQAQCADIQNAVWVTAMGESVCMRYYLSTAGGMGPYPVIFMQGDKIGRYDRATNTFERAGEYKDVDSRSLQRIADSYSLATGTTGIYLARVGVDGSSGHHGIKDTVLEVNLTNAALDAIKQRYRFGGFNLTGQSGGSTNIGGLLALRTDIRCAAPGSGRLALPQAKLLHDRPLDVINPVNYVETIARNSRARILVLTDYQDQHVPAEHQIPFVEALLRAGGQIEQFFVRATDEGHHNVAPYTYPAIVGCMHGASHEDIAAALREVDHRLAVGQSRTAR